MSATIHDYITPVASPNGNSAEKSLQHSLPTWKERAKQLVAKGKEEGGVVARWAAPVLLSAALFYGFNAWQSGGTQMREMQGTIAKQNEMLIRLDQKLEDKKGYDNEKLQEAKDSAKLAELTANSAKNELNVIKGMLGASNQKTLDKLKQN